MKFVYDSSIKLQNDEKEILDSLNHKSLEKFFINPEIKSLIKSKNNNENVNEDIFLYCVHKSLSRPKKYHKSKNDAMIISIDIPESSASVSSASASIDIEKIQKQCPTNKYWRIWYHTHNDAISAQSLNDYQSIQLLNKAKIGRTMCAAGVFSISCHIQHNENPIIFNSKWSKNFWKQMKKDNAIPNELFVNSWNNNINTRKINTDQILCYYNKKNNKNPFQCTARNFKDSEIKEFNLGSFSSIAFDGEIDQYEDDYGFGQLIQADDGKLNCRKSGNKLLCQ